MSPLKQMFGFAREELSYDGLFKYRSPGLLKSQAKKRFYIEKFDTVTGVVTFRQRPEHRGDYTDSQFLNFMLFMNDFVPATFEDDQDDD